jgi:hypothetical protein
LEESQWNLSRERELQVRTHTTCETFFGQPFFPPLLDKGNKFSRCYHDSMLDKKYNTRREHSLFSNFASISNHHCIHSVVFANIIRFIYSAVMKEEEAPSSAVLIQPKLEDSALIV